MPDPINTTPPIETPEALALETPETTAVEPPEGEITRYSEEQLAERLAARDLEWADKLTGKDAEIESIRSQFDTASIQRSLTEAATKGHAFSAEQILNVL